jgi:DNA primase large subunit
MFILVNFLTSAGWSYENVEKILKTWNAKNKEPLKETLLVGQIRYHKMQKKKILPPNCQNQMYYKDFGVCKPDNLCAKIKNPVQYAKRKVYHLNNNKKPSKEGKNNLNNG